MEIEKMREFVLFSRYLNFSKAAARLNMAQPTLSSHIIAMEKELGFSLVQRGKNLVLTLPGKRFCADAERIVAEYDRSLALCRSMSSHKQGVLTFEKPVHPGGLGRIFNTLVLQFEREHPAVIVKSRADDNYPLDEVLLNGTVDFVMVPSECVMGEWNIPCDDVTVTPIPIETRTSYYLWLHKTHPLVSKGTVALADMHLCEYLMPSAMRYQVVEQFMNANADKTGGRLLYTRWPGSFEDCVLNLRPDEAIWVSANEISDAVFALNENRVFVPLSGMDELMRPCLVSLSENENPAVAEFRDYLAGLA